MPINMITGQKYSIDYQKMRNELMELNIFNDKTIQQKYVDTWVNELMNADSISVSSYFDPNNRELLLKEKLEAPEIFQALVKMKTNDMYIHFRVSRIIQMLKINNVSEADAQDIEIGEFTSHRTISWTETEKNVENDKPIIIVPFMIGKTYKELVIDGNHRITTAIREGKKYIKAFILSSQAVVENKLLSSSFDLLLYVFQNELVWMGSFYNKNNIYDEQALITNSFLISGKINIAY